MIVRLTASCNNRCPFCIVDDEIAAHRFRPREAVIAEIDLAAPDEVVDIFGGEPTIDPVFWDIAEYALSTGRIVTLATNCRLFSHRPTAHRLAELAEGRLLVRTSLLGSTAELHDRLNGVRGHAFDQTVAGIANLTAEGFDVHTNIVILADNLDDLLGTALVAFAAGSRNLKLSGLVRTARTLDMIPEPTKVRRSLARLVPLLHGLGINVRLEKLTPCLVPDSIGSLQKEADPASDISGWFVKRPACRTCAFESACPGAERGSVERYGDAWLAPFAALPENLVTDVDACELHLESGRFDRPLVRVNLPEDLEEAIAVLPAVLRFQASHPHLYIVT